MRRAIRLARLSGWAARAGAKIGHGYLAERALTPVLPSEEDFPYAIRSVTEIMEPERFDVDGSDLFKLSGADGCWRALSAR